MRATSAFAALARRSARAEDWTGGAMLLALGVIPAIEFALRLLLRTGIPGASGYVQHLTLLVGFVGAMIATREDRHLALRPDGARAGGHRQGIVASARAIASVAVGAGLCWASFDFVYSELAAPARVGPWVPVWAFEAILPVAFAVVTLRFVLAEDGWQHRAIAACGIPAAAAVGWIGAPLLADLLTPAIVLMIGTAALGAPIFVVIGGVALLLFLADGLPVASIPVETYRIIVSPTIPAIPLFTLTGYLLAESGASRRLVAVSQTLFGWLPGGAAVAATVAAAFFATLTGASGVAIVALGGLLMPILLKSGYPFRFSLGMVTAGGSIGILFPPSLAVILYGVVAHIPIPDLFLAGLVPGALMVAAVCVFGAIAGRGSGGANVRFDAVAAGRALWQAKWELALPILVIAGVFGGWATLLEAAALAAVYALAIERLIHRDLDLARDLPRILRSSLTLVGGVFVILGVAMGVANYVVDAEIPAKAAALVREHIESKFQFLLMLNLMLLIVGCLLDIYSAIVVVAPILLPVAAAFGVDPLHLAVIFLLNLELGFLTPPVGMNLFLSAYRFERPVTEVCRSALPFLGLLAAIVLVVTYVPELVLGARH